MAKRKAEWQNKYIEKTYDRINLLVPKGEKEIVKAAADRAGQSVNAYILEAVQQRMESESGDKK